MHMQIAKMAYVKNWFGYQVETFGEYLNGKSNRQKRFMHVTTNTKTAATFTHATTATKLIQQPLQL